MFPPRNTTPKQPFSHLEILKVCQFYRNLLATTRGVQATINESIDRFQHSHHGRPTPELTQLLRELSLIDASVRGPLLDEIMQVEIATIKWQMKSSKLKTEARRQARYRAERKGASSAHETPHNDAQARTALGYDEFGPIAEEEYNYDKAGLFDEADVTDATDSASEDTSPAPVPMSPTMQRALRGMSELPSDPENIQRPDTSDYKKSGLV